ncbi:MAG: chemotaxis protein CheA [Clostridiales bacterium]|nr:chemotaxis protein CheA [Clostridiales bacterium]
MDVNQYLEIFIDETKEHLQSLNEHLLILEKEPENAETINEIFRAAHSLKGMAGTMGYKKMQRLTHHMENVFQEVRVGNIKVSSKLYDGLFQCIDALEEYLDNIINESDEGTNDNEPIINALNEILHNTTLNEKEETALQTNGSNNNPDTSTDNFSSIPLTDFEAHAANEAIKIGMKLYGITVTVESTCILKAARAFLVFKNLEPLGEVIRSQPSVQDLEDERFDLNFSLFIISREPLDKIIKTIKNVSEIKEVLGAEVEPPKIDPSLIEEIEYNTNNDENKKTIENADGKRQQHKQSGKPVVNRSVRVDIEKLDVLMNLVSELIIAKNGIVSVSATKGSAVAQGVKEQVEYLESITTNLHESVMKVRMVPIESVVNRFPRMIRDLSKKLNKKMELYMSGEETELDRTVIDEIGDPLMHILRNSADHGLESPEVRAERGKPEVGSIYLDAYQDGNNVVIEVKDDGNGIDVNAVKRKAVEKGAITQEQSDVMDDNTAIQLLFKPSFSTAEVVSDVSGRGVGLDIVKTKIEALGGDIEVQTEHTKGSTFIIRLPLTLAIIQALMIIVGEEKYAIPLSTIQTIEDISVNDIKYVRGKEVIHLRGNVIPLIRLDKVLELESKEEPESLIVVVINKGEKQAGLVVDQLIGQQEIVIKSLGKFINNNKLIGGATILGDGEVALILDTGTLL